MLKLTLPVAPSANNAFINRKGGKGFGRIKSSKYRTWLKQADAYYMMQKKNMTPVQGPYFCRIIFPGHMRGDLDGRAKLIIDWMVSRGLTSDDKFLQELALVRNLKWDKDLVWIVVQEHGRTEHDATEASSC